MSIDEFSLSNDPPSLLDLYATGALAGLIGHNGINPDLPGPVVEKAWEIADAMLKARRSPSRD